jgi:hypothetical protein
LINPYICNASLIVKFESISSLQRLCKIKQARVYLYLLPFHLLMQFFVVLWRFLRVSMHCRYYLESLILFVVLFNWTLLLNNFPPLAGCGFDRQFHECCWFIYWDCWGSQRGPHCIQISTWLMKPTKNSRGRTICGFILW